MDTSIVLSPLSSYSNGCYTLVYGFANTNAKPSQIFTFEPIVSSDVSIVGNFSNYDFFKRHVASTPLIKPTNDIHFYDTQGNHVGHYDKDRKSNASGTVQIKTPNPCFLSDIVIPKTSHELTYVFLSHYVAINNTSVTEFIDMTIKTDIQCWQSKYNFDNVVFVIEKALYERINHIFNECFIEGKNYKSIIVTEDCHQEKHLVEILFGKQITGTPSCFNGMLCFDTTFTVLQSQCYRTSAKGPENILFTSRTNGRVEIATKSDRAEGNFIIVLYREEPFVGDIIFTEEKTGTTFKTEDCERHALADAYLLAYFESCYFLNQIYEAERREDKFFVHKHSATIVEKMFGNVPGKITSKSIRPEDESDESARSCITNFIDIENETYSKLYNKMINRSHVPIKGGFLEYSASSPPIFERQVTMPATF